MYNGQCIEEEKKKSEGLHLENQGVRSEKSRFDAKRKEAEKMMRRCEIGKKEQRRWV